MTSTFGARLQFENDGTHCPHCPHGRKCVPCVPLCSGDTHGTRPGRVLAGRAGRVLAGRVLAGRVLAHTAHGVVSAHYPSLLVSAYQPGGGGGRAERLGPQLRSVSEQFLFL